MNPVKNQPRLRTLAPMMLPLFLLVALALSGCAPEKKEDPTLAAIRNDLKTIIENDFPLANYELAQGKLNKIIKDYGGEGGVLSQDPDLRAQVYFTSVLADTNYQIQEWLKSFSLILNIVLSGVLPTTQGAPPFQSLATLLPQEGIVGGVIDGILKTFEAFFQNEIKKLAEVQKNPNFTIVYPSVPLRFNLAALGGSDVELVNLKGEYDLGEAFALSAVYRVVSGILGALIALDLDIQVNSKSLDMLKYISELFSGSRFSDDPVGTISNLIAIFLDSQTSFLGLSDSQKMQSAGRSLGDGFPDLLKALQAMMAERDNQDDDLIAFYREGAFPQELDPEKRFQSLCNNPTDPSLKGCLFLHLQLGNLFQALSIGFSLKMVPVPVNEKYFTSITNIRDSFYGKAGARINWVRDIAPLVALAANTIIQSGILQGLIVVATDLLGSGSGNTDITQRYQGIFDLLQSNIVTPDLIESFLTGLIPDIFEFDVGAYFANPKSLRTFLPFWKPVTSSPDGKTFYWSDSRLLLEYECNDSDGNPYNEPVSGTGSTREILPLCPEGQALDLTHHTTEATPWITEATFQDVHRGYLGALKLLNNGNDLGIPPDCVKSSWIYLPLRDPSLGGILWINPGPLIKDETNFTSCPELRKFFGQNQFELANNYTLEALVPLLFQQIIGVLGSLQSGAPIPELVLNQRRGT